MSEYFAIFFFHDPLPRYVRKDNPNCTSPKWCYLHLSPPAKKKNFADAVASHFQWSWFQTLSLEIWKKKSTNSSEFPRSQAERLFMKKEWLLAIKTSKDSSKGPMSSYRSAIKKMLIVFLCRPSKKRKDEPKPTSWLRINIRKTSSCLKLAWKRQKLAQNAYRSA